MIFHDFPLMADVIAIIGLMLLPLFVLFMFGRCYANWQWDVNVMVSLMADVIAIVFLADVNANWWLMDCHLTLMWMMLFPLGFLGWCYCQ